MVTLDSAILTVLEHSKANLSTETVPLWESIGRVLAVDVASDINMPPFHKSAVDGYACRNADLGQPLRVVEVIPAGQMPQIEVTMGTCSKIMTGAPVPVGADCVIMVEEVEIIDDTTIQFTGKYTKTNIAPFAEDVRVGDVVLKKGSLIEPQHIAILASVGVSRVEVATRPKVSILITGDELVEVDKKPINSQIRNSNGHQLYAQVIRAGAIPIYGGIVEDTLESTRNAIANALAESDIVVLTGGVSMGDFDFVPNVLADLGVDIKFQTIAVQPGKPTLFGVKGDKLVFGLPGNPVSSLFQFDLLVRSAVLNLMGAAKPTESLQKMPLASDFSRIRAERLALAPARINAQGEVDFLDYHGSAHIFSLAQAQVMVIIPIGVNSLTKGELVDVRPL
ncbi:MAG: molybdopterin molybdotransferase MoeA [Tenuifilaceae bacterium]|jgi:molybdopterin molybdotransferase|nr:molybdopterin molybdotransferase MoeA [Tenuifilaceae bacterium]